MLAIITSSSLFILAVNWDTWFLPLKFEQPPPPAHPTIPGTTTAGPSVEEKAQDKKIKKAKGSIIKQKYKLELRSSKFFIQNTNEPALRLENGSTSLILRFGCDFGAQ